MGKGLLIAFEGIDKSGKGTQSRKLAEGLDAVRIAFPRYETTVGKVIRRHLDGMVALRYEHSIDSSFMELDGETTYRRDPADPLMFQCLMLADKVEAAVEIQELLWAGKNVVLDRWVYSALVYGGSDGLDNVWLERICQDLPRPDLVVLLDIDPEVSSKRGRPAGDDRTKDDRYERDLAKLKRVRALYLAAMSLTTQLSRYRFVIDATLPVETVHEQVVAHLRELNLLR